MAEGQDDTEKTEDPTQKRLDDALKRGDVAKSQELNTWFIFAAAALALSAFSGSMGSGLTTTFRGLIANAHMLRADGPGLMRLVDKLGLEVLAAIAIPMLLLMLAALGANLVQHRFVWSAESVTPKFSKISPLAGIKRLFSKMAIANFVKGIFKLVLIGTVLTVLMWPERNRLELLVWTDPLALMPLIMALSMKLMGAVVAILAIVAAADFFFQYRQWYERQKMSLQEIKDEFKQTDGDPAVKGKIRQLRQKRMAKRMMAAVPKATVVITNPTHYSVALQYEKGMQAPICVAKGVDAVAFRIRKIAGEHQIPTVENVPLARALYATVEVDQAIPPEHYKAVAEVIGYVMRLRHSLRH
ncbi:MAG: flagellar biosynthesis protein FlhB [Pseudolabrys sp.]|nr:flagellar biosynthesis protein FlhB [Pseudolabrys sp.]MCW5682919.1 flagellar biosynthesis protein FlhB [Pseudolabrys sp.]